MSFYPSALVIDALELDVHLGVPEQEREQTQKVVVDIRLYFKQSPVCAGDDSTNDFVCYDEICQAIRGSVADQPVRFIEYLAESLHNVVREYISEKLSERVSEVACWLSITKPNLPVDYKVGGSRYIISDVPEDAKVIEVA
ncbi:MAG: dihydroneopterin aldolase [Rickettsiales bacterium]|nr:dihydroneopterin aldolase [Rickettsiales bacterium]